jgi:hypothetical protein
MATLIQQKQSATGSGEFRGNQQNSDCHFAIEIGSLTPAFKRRGGSIELRSPAERSNFVRRRSDRMPVGCLQLDLCTPPPLAAMINDLCAAKSLNLAIDGIPAPTVREIRLTRPDYTPITSADDEQAERELRAKIALDSVAGERE